MKNPTLSPAEQEALRANLRRFIDERHNGVASAAAAELDVAPSALTTFLRNERGAGLKIVSGLARATGRSVDMVLGHAAAHAALAEGVIAVPVTVSTLPGFEEARAALERWSSRAPRPIPADVISLVGDVSLPVPIPRVTPQILRDLCEIMMRVREPELDE